MPPSSRHQAPPPGSRGSRLRLRIQIQCERRIGFVHRFKRASSVEAGGDADQWLWASGHPVAPARPQVSASPAHVHVLCFETGTPRAHKHGTVNGSKRNRLPPTRSGSARRSTTHITLHSRHISLEHSAASKLRQDQTVNATSSSRPQPSMPRQPHRSRLIQDHAQPSASSPVACRPYTSS